MSDSILDEFAGEANELLDDAEKSLLSLDKDGDFSSNYDSIFRALHSVKGSAGMLGLIDIQKHVHSLEDRFAALKSNPAELKLMINYFITGIDLSRKLLNGEKVDLENAFKQYETKAVITNQELKTEAYFVVALSISNNNLLEKIMNLSLSPSLRITFENVGVDTHSKSKLSESKASVLLSDSTIELIKNHFGLLEIPIVLTTKEANKVSINNDLFHCSNDVINTDELGYILRNAIRHRTNIELLSRAKNLIIYMYSDLQQFLIEQNKIEIKNSINIQMKSFFKDFSAIK